LPCVLKTRNRHLLTRRNCAPLSAGVWRSRRLGRGPLRTMDTSASLCLASKLRSLGADAGDLDMVLHAVKGRARVAAGTDVVLAGDDARGGHLPKATHHRESQVSAGAGVTFALRAAGPQ